MPALSRSAPLRRVGHKGADRIIPGNTTASFDAALATGVDMIEFDVLPADPAAPEAAPLVLAHDYGHDVRSALSLEAALAHLASPAFAGVELDVDLKGPGYEARVLDALRTAGLLERTLVSTQLMPSLVILRALAPGLRLGWSVPRTKRDYTRSRVWIIPVYSALAYLRRRMPTLVARALREGCCDAIMAHYGLVTPALVRVVAEAGGELYVWTVDDARRIRALEALGVTGVITNDPRLFWAPALS